MAKIRSEEKTKRKYKKTIAFNEMELKAIEQHLEKVSN